MKLPRENEPCASLLFLMYCASAKQKEPGTQYITPLNDEQSV